MPFGPGPACGSCHSRERFAPLRGILLPTSRHNIHIVSTWIPASSSHLPDVMGPGEVVPVKGAWTMWVWMLAGTFWGLFAMSVAWLVRRRRSRP